MDRPTPASSLCGGRPGCRFRSIDGKPLVFRQQGNQRDIAAEVVGRPMMKHRPQYPLNISFILFCWFVNVPNRLQVLLPFDSLRTAFHRSNATFQSALDSSNAALNACRERMEKSTTQFRLTV